MPRGRSAIIIGGGVIGRTAAFALCRAGHHVTLIEAEARPRGASWGNAGHIATEQVAPLASRTMLHSVPARLFRRGGAVALPPRDIAAWTPFAWRMLRASGPERFARGQAALTAMLAQALPAWRRMLDALGARDLLREEGHFVAWESAASAAEGRARWMAAPIGTAGVRGATDAELAMLRGLVRAPIADAIRFEGSGQIADLGTLGEALDGAIERRVTRVQRLIVEDGRTAVLLEDGTRLDSDAIIVAAGVASGDLLRQLGHKVPMIAERGYHIQSAASAWPDDVPPVVFEDRSMIVTRFRSGLRAASFVEFGRAASPPDPRKWARLRGHVAALGLPFDLPGHEWMGARPTLPDYLPAIGRSRRATNLLYAFGHQHLGLTLAATTAEAVVALVEREIPPLDLTPFDLDRLA